MEEEKMASEQLLQKLNDAIAREMQVSIQYLWQHVQARGVKGEVVKDMFKKIGIVEMKHAEGIAERLNVLGGTPTTKPDTITIGESFEEMVTLDIKAEEGAIKMYKEIIKMANDEGDHVTANMFISILEDEEGHLNNFQSVLEES